MFFFFFLCIPNDVISNSLNSNQLFINYRYVVVHTSLVFVKLSTPPLAGEKINLKILEDARNTLAVS